MPLLGTGVEKAHEVALRYHGYLSELIAVDAENFAHPFIDVGAAGDDGAVGQSEFGLGLLLGQALPLLCGTQIGGIAPYFIHLSAVRKGKLDECGRLRRGVLGAKAVHLPHIAAWLTVEGEGYGVEDGSFARARIARDEVEPACAECRHIELHFARIRTEGGHF